MNTRRNRPASPTTPAQCLHADCHAHHAHPANRPATPAQPATPPAAPRRRFKITKNVIIGFLIVIIIGLVGSLNDADAKIADLQQQVRHAKVAPADSTARLDYVIKLCKAISAKGDFAQCVTETLATPKH